MRRFSAATQQCSAHMQHIRCGRPYHVRQQAADALHRSTLSRVLALCVFVRGGERSFLSVGAICYLRTVQSGVVFCACSLTNAAKRRVFLLYQGVRGSACFCKRMMHVLVCVALCAMCVCACTHTHTHPLHTYTHTPSVHIPYNFCTHTIHPYPLPPPLLSLSFQLT